MLKVGGLARKKGCQLYKVGSSKDNEKLSSANVKKTATKCFFTENISSKICIYDSIAIFNL